MRLRLEHQLKTLSRTTVSSRCSQSILPLLAGRQYLQIQSRNPGPSLKRAFTSAKPTQAQNLLPRDFNAINTIPGVWSRTIVLPDLVEDFRELYSIESMKGTVNAVEAARECKNATRALIALLHGGDSPDQQVKLSNIQEVIPQSNGRAWKIIRDRLEHGKVKILEELDEETRVLALFCRVNSVGAKRAKKLHELGYRTLDDLRAIKLTHAQQVGLKYFEDFEALIPRSEVDAIAKDIFRAVRKADPDHECEIVGSYRRGEKWSSDVDLVVRHPAFDGTDEDTSRALLKGICDGFADIDVLSEKALASGAKRYHTLVKLPGHRFARRLDLRMVGWDDYHYMLLGSTGDLDLMKYLRQVAAQKELFLSEYGMGPRIYGEQRDMMKGADTFDPKRKIIVNSEEEIFEALGLPYVEPTKRSYRYWSQILPKLNYRK